MPHVVQFGAGAIGRGFLGQLWQEAGYETIFVDTDTALIEALNAQKSYTLRLVDNESEQKLTIQNFRALHASDTKAVSQAIATCDFAATAVGFDNLAAVGPVLAQGLRKRGKSAPRLNTLVCENGVSPEVALGRSTLAALPFSQKTGVCLHPTIVDRMVPPPQDSLTITTEPHGKLSYQFRWQEGTAPPPHLHYIPSLDWNQAFFQKLYLHNGGHFLVACLGLKRGQTTIADAVADPAILFQLHGFWSEVNAGLHGYYQKHTQEYAKRLPQLPKPTEPVDITPALLSRFQNRAISDTCARVARNAERKLEPHERLLGARALCTHFGIETPFIDWAIAAAEALLPASAERC